MGLSGHVDRPGYAGGRMSGRRAAAKGGRTGRADTDGGIPEASGAAGAPGIPAQRGGRAELRRSRRGGRRRILKIAGLSTAGVVLVAGGGVGYLYMHLAGNIKTSQLFTGTDKKDAVGVEIPNKFGQTPLNVLLIGSDTRDTKTDCDLGGACATNGSGANADVEMLVHLSADRSNISVMSIPRDLETELPACTDPANGTSTGEHFGQINSSLQYGPACTDMAVHKLTGITVDDFAMVDFGGVVNISNALGGVDVCVNSNMYDINSGLKLTEGTHSLKGVAALQFLRTRDSFGDGSDNVGRTSATHIFFTDMINKLKNAGTISDVPAMYTIANAATKSLTVSPDLDTPLKLISLAQQLNKVPTDRITFATMQNVDDQHDSHVTEGPQASVLFEAIANDQSLTTASGASSGAGSVPAPTSAAGSRSGSTSGSKSTGSAPPAHTAGQSGSSPAPADTAAALNGTFSQNAGQSKCVDVSKDYTENKLGLPTATWNSPGETPQEMFQIYSSRPNSAP